jgi:hypothetical protein
MDLEMSDNFNAFFEREREIASNLKITIKRSLLGKTKCANGLYLEQNKKQCNKGSMQTIYYNNKRVRFQI